MTLLSILVITFLSGFISLIGSFFLAQKKSWPKRFILQLTSFASGVLLATSLLHLAPEAIETLDSHLVFSIIFLSIVLFFVLERLILWHHHHDEEHCHTIHASAWFITFGDSVHNFLDGVLIAGAFLVNPALGLITAFAVAAHEIPQEIADFSVMVSGGMKRSQALILNMVSALSSMLGAVVTYFFAVSIDSLTPYIIAFSVGMFLYISLTDLIPQLHAQESASQKQKWSQLALFFLGVCLIASMTFLLPHTEAHESESHSATDSVEIEGQ